MTEQPEKPKLESVINGNVPMIHFLMFFQTTQTQRRLRFGFWQVF